MSDSIIFGSIWGALVIYSAIDAFNRYVLHRDSDEILVTYRIICKDRNESEITRAHLTQNKKFRVAMDFYVSGKPHVAVIEQVSKG